MKLEPACVLSIALSRRFLRSCTSGLSWEPNVAVAMRHCGLGADVEVLVGVLVELIEGVVDVLVAAAVTCIAMLTGWMSAPLVPVIERV